MLTSYRAKCKHCGKRLAVHLSKAKKPSYFLTRHYCRSEFFKSRVSVSPEEVLGQ